MASIGPNSPSTITNDAAVGTLAWSNPSNAASSNDTYAESVALGSAIVTTNYLKSVNFGFSVPSGATIDGIVVEIERKASAGSASINVVDQTVKLVKNGTVVGTNKADTALKWPTSDTTKTYGSSSDLWGTSWTDSDINSSTFGVVINVVLNIGIKVNLFADIDHVKITVYYTGGGGSTSASALLLAGD